MLHTSVKTKPIDYCKLCKNKTQLEISHAIPKAVFNNIFRNASGKAVAINADTNTHTQYSSDSWAEHQLCKNCEAKLNNQYDSYGINLLKSTFNQEKKEYGLTFKNIDRKKFRLFFLSILWRSALSKNPHYKNIKLSTVQLEILRSAFYNNTNVPYSNFTVAVYKLENFTNIESLNSDNIRTNIMAPFVKNFSNISTICYMFYGFFIEICLIKQPRSILLKPGVLFGNSLIFMAPYQEILDLPEVLNMFVTALNKEDSGKTKIKAIS